MEKLSGGEKNKLALAQLTYLRPNLLILDEPTNHLDIDSREALLRMLRDYDGTILLISHDRYLLDQITTHTLDLRDGIVTFFDGPYHAYRESIQQATNYRRPVQTVRREAQSDGNSLTAGMKGVRVFVAKRETPQLTVTTTMEGGPTGRRPPFRLVYDRDENR